jgi:hypothetical protein
MLVASNLDRYEIHNLRTLFGYGRFNGCCCRRSCCSSTTVASGHTLCECSICIVSSRLLLGRNLKFILALAPEMSENIRVVKVFSSFTYMCCLGSRVFLTRRFAGEYISLWGAFKVMKASSRPSLSL